MARLESGRDDFRVRCEDLEREVQDLQHRNEELTSLAEEAQALKDEMDVLRWVSPSCYAAKINIKEKGGVTGGLGETHETCLDLLCLKLCVFEC